MRCKLLCHISKKIAGYETETGVVYSVKPKYEYPEWFVNIDEKTKALHKFRCPYCHDIFKFWVFPPKEFYHGFFNTIRSLKKVLATLFVVPSTLLLISWYISANTVGTVETIAKIVFWVSLVFIAFVVIEIGSIFHTERIFEKELTLGIDKVGSHWVFGCCGTVLSSYEGYKIFRFSPIEKEEKLDEEHKV